MFPYPMCSWGKSLFQPPPTYARGQCCKHSHTFIILCPRGLHPGNTLKTCVTLLSLVGSSTKSHQPDGGDLLDHIRGGVQVNQALVDPVRQFRSDQGFSTVRLMWQRGMLQDMSGACHTQQEPGDTQPVSRLQASRHKQNDMTQHLDRGLALHGTV